MEVSTIVSDYEVSSDTCGDLVGTYFYERTYSYGLAESKKAISAEVQSLLTPTHVQTTKNPNIENIGVPEPVYTDRHVFTGLVATISFALEVKEQSKKSRKLSKKKSIVNKKFYETFVLIEPFEYASPNQAVFPVVKNNKNE